MRDIRFRGRTDEGEWVHGSPLVPDAENYTAIIMCDTHRGTVTCEIEPETLGQYTGLKDAKGNEIYEGDILFLEDDEVPFGCVAWHPDGYFAIDRHFGKYDFSKFKCRPLGEMLNRELDNGTILRFIVDGNIHDGITI